MSRMITRAAEAWSLLGGLCILAVAGLMSLNALLLGLTRGLGALGLEALAPGVSGIYGTEEIVGLLASVAALAFFPYCHLRQGHIAVGILVDLAPERLRRANAVLAHLLACGAALFLGWWLILGMAEVFDDHTVTSLLGLPHWPFYLPGVVSMALWALVAAQSAFDTKGTLHGPA